MKSDSLRLIPSHRNRNKKTWREQDKTVMNASHFKLFSTLIFKKNKKLFFFYFFSKSFIQHLHLWTCRDVGIDEKFWTKLSEMIRAAPRTQANLWRCFLKFAYHLVHLQLLTPQGPQENLIFSEDVDRSYSLKHPPCLSVFLFQFLSGQKRPY